MSSMVMCESCNGSGIGSSGDVDSTCYECNGSGGVRLRDSKGRFAKYVPPQLSQRLSKTGADDE